MEPVEPRKRRHGPLRGASFYTRRGLGLREFMNKLPQMKPWPSAAATAANMKGFWGVWSPPWKKVKLFPGCLIMTEHGWVGLSDFKAAKAIL